MSAGSRRATRFGRRLVQTRGSGSGLAVPSPCRRGLQTRTAARVRLDPFWQWISRHNARRWRGRGALRALLYCELQLSVRAQRDAHAAHAGGSTGQVDTTHHTATGRAPEGVGCMVGGGHADRCMHPERSCGVYARDILRRRLSRLRQLPCGVLLPCWWCVWFGRRAYHHDYPPPRLTSLPRLQTT